MDFCKQTRSPGGLIHIGKGGERQNFSIMIGETVEEIVYECWGSTIYLNLQISMWSLAVGADICLSVIFK